VPKRREKEWQEAKEIVMKKRDKSESKLTDRDWGLVQTIYKNKIQSNFSKFNKLVTSRYEVISLLRIEHAQMLEHHVDQWGEGDTSHWETQENGDLLVYKNDKPVFYIAPHLLPALQRALVSEHEEDRLQERERKRPEPRKTPLTPKVPEEGEEESEANLRPSGGKYEMR